MFNIKKQPCWSQSREMVKWSTFITEGSSDAGSFYQFIVYLMSHTKIPVFIHSSVQNEKKDTIILKLVITERFIIINLIPKQAGINVSQINYRVVTGPNTCTPVPLLDLLSLNNCYSLSFANILINFQKFHFRNVPFLFYELMSNSLYLKKIIKHPSLSKWCHNRNFDK